MRRLIWGLGLAFIPACGLISGLGDLDVVDMDAGLGVDAIAEASPADVVVVDGASDATTDATTDASPKPDGSVVIDASAPDVGKDTGPDTGVDASTGLQCGAVPNTCVQSAPICCFDTNKKTYACGASACSIPSFAVECDFDSCPVNQVCCRRTQVPSVKCETMLACPGLSSQVVWICNPLAPVCPGGKTCQASNLLPGYFICL